ncbi:hypothetical protein HEK616_00390 [Streptomyces nigrescens]|uniref:Secreted protein n=1 Tax=Streptomyces nigrescens TaxID=1920 RepID=A0ABM7ZJN3_STRNI|nr:hypothetical protein [Streptomyces nigrescens]BDM66552.1 hypothetical protein HEK616_00390 [Streptomyces nigrescens]
MTRAYKAVLLTALTVAAAGAAATPAMADSTRPISGQVSTFDHHAPITGSQVASGTAVALGDNHTPVAPADKHMP